jgi:uncharacterized protein (TIGR00251 family)
VDVQELDGGATFAVRVAPRSSRNAILGEHQGALKVRLRAPPVDDRADQALPQLLAEAMNVLLSAVRILSGLKDRTKPVAVAGVPKARIAALIAPDANGAH